MNFYNELSPLYDQMISFESRFNNELKIFEKVLNKFPADSILDAGCGSGYHSILLASQGKKMTAFDPAEKMIQLARDNSKKYNHEIEFFETDFLGFPSIIPDKFDALYTLGNSFVHLTETKTIEEALTNFCNTLKPRGYACIGIVNYDRIINLNELEISRKDKNGTIFHRYYTLNENTVTFHVDVSGKANRHLETELYPLQSEELRRFALNAGFTHVELYGNLKLEKYEPLQSENIVAFMFK